VYSMCVHVCVCILYSGHRHSRGSDGLNEVAIVRMRDDDSDGVVLGGFDY